MEYIGIIIGVVMIIGSEVYLNHNIILNNIVSILGIVIIMRTLSHSDESSTRWESRRVEKEVETINIETE